MKKKIKQVMRKRKRKLAIRLENKNQERSRPVLSTNAITYDMSEKISAIHCGGIGVIKELVNRLGVPEMINNRLKLFQRHKPYHESDHVLNMAYNIICGGRNIEDLELLRNNEAYLDALGAERIPDPTTAGDFLRRFSEADIRSLMDGINDVTVGMLKAKQNKKIPQDGIVDVDGKIQETFGECKEGMDMSYKGVWGFSPLVITEATSGAHLFVVNRSGNKLSQEGAGEWIDASVDVVKRAFNKVYLRGDSAFSLTWKFDEWTEKEVGFIFGYDARENLIKRADLLRENEWQAIERSVKENKSGKERKKKPRVKKSMVEKRKYRTLTQKKEYLSEFRYRPTKCGKEYRVIVLKKIIDVTEGQQFLFEDFRYLFYITNIDEMSTVELLRFIQGRCNHENKIEQLDNGIHALKMPASEFLANWAYMAICMLAWNLKSWIGLAASNADKRRKIIACEFKSFQNRLINIPCQILTMGRRIIFRFLNYNPWVRILLDISDSIKRLHYATV